MGKAPTLTTLPSNRTSEMAPLLRTLTSGMSMERQFRKFRLSRMVWKPRRSKWRRASRTSLLQGSFMKISTGGKGMCRKNPFGWPIPSPRMKKAACMR